MIGRPERPAWASTWIVAILALALGLLLFVWLGDHAWSAPAPRADETSANR